MSTVSTWVAVPVLPPAVTEATTVCDPSARVPASTVHAPAAAVVVRVWPLTVTVTVGLPGSPVVPEIVGVVSLVPLVAPPAIVTTGW